MEKTDSSPSSLSQHLQPEEEECFSHSDLLTQQHFFQRQGLLRQNSVVFFFVARTWAMLVGTAAVAHDCRRRLQLCRSSRSFVAIHSVRCPVTSIHLMMPTGCFRCPVSSCWVCHFVTHYFKINGLQGNVPKFRIIYNGHKGDQNKDDAIVLQ